MSPSARRERVYALADALEAEVEVDPELVETDVPWGRALRGTIWVAGPGRVTAVPAGKIQLTHDPGESSEAYLVALHELGHLADMRCRRRPGWCPSRWGRSSVRHEEAVAWLWAIENAGYELTPEDWAEIAWRLRTWKNDKLLRATSETFEQLLARAEEASCG